MSEAFEVHESPVRRLISGGIFAVLIVGGIYLGFFHEPSRDGSVFSPGELRRVVSDYRERQAEKAREDMARLQTMLAEMRSIRNTWIGKSDSIGDDFESVLDESERRFREAAAVEPESVEQLHEVYDAIRSVEQDMLTVYREFLAARMVGLRPSLLYDEAFENSQTPRPTRPDLDVDALYRDITTTEPGGGLDEFKAQIKVSTIEIREMVENGKKLLAFTRKSSQQAGDGIDVDLSSLDMAMLGYRGPELMPHELDFTYSADVGNYDAIPGRRVVAGAEAKNEWMYIDSWYIIGPFPGDRRRENLDVRFGPEANVNLDDVFTGKDDQKVRWQYTKTGYVEQDSASKTAYWKIEPANVTAYGIWYAFTEIYSDSPREVWIATGTDDYGKLWINDELVWRSPKERKPYNATENVQLAKLRQGQNKILFRVENAGGTMGWSLMMRLAE